MGFFKRVSRVVRRSLRLNTNAHNHPNLSFPEHRSHPSPIIHHHFVFHDNPSDMNPLVNPNAQNGAQPSHVFVPPGGAYASHPPPTEQPQVAPSENPPTRTTSPSATLSRLSNIFVGAATRAGDPQAPIDLSLSHHVGPPPPQRNRYRTIPLPPLPSSPDDAQTSYREVEILDAYPSRINGDPSEATPNLSSIGVFDASPQVQTAWQVPRYLLSTRNLKVETPISIERFLTILDSCVDLESLTVSIAASEPPETTVIARPATAANLIELSMKTAIVPKSLLDAFVTPRLRILRLEWDAQSSGNPMPISPDIGLSLFLHKSSCFLNTLSLVGIFPDEVQLMECLKLPGSANLRNLIVRASNSGPYPPSPLGRGISETTLNSLTQLVGGEFLCPNLARLEISSCRAPDGHLAAMVRKRHRGVGIGLGIKPFNLCYSFGDSQHLHPLDRLELAALARIQELTIVERPQYCVAFN